MQLIRIGSNALKTLKIKQRKECLTMKDTFKGKARKWYVVGGLLLLMSIASVAYVQAAGLTPMEKYWLTYMREEEKLARDVYSVLGDKWDNQLLKDTSGSEQKHMDSLKPLLDNHVVPDPAAGNGQGVFTNSDLQKLYNELIPQGSVSLVEALKVGALVEQKDIADLKQGIATANHEDLKTVYDNLSKGSAIHLSAFLFELSKHSTTTPTTQTASQESGGIFTTGNIIMLVVAVAAVVLVGAFFLRGRRK